MVFSKNGAASIDQPHRKKPWSQHQNVHKNHFQMGGGLKLEK